MEFLIPGMCDVSVPSSGSPPPPGGGDCPTVAEIVAGVMAETPTLPEVTAAVVAGIIAELHARTA